MKQYTQQQLKKLSEFFQQGQQALHAGMFSQAEKHFLEMLKIGPTITEAQNGLAFVYAASKQHAKASAQFKLVLKANPQHAQTHHNLANSLYQQNNYEDSIQHYQAAIKFDTKLVDSHIHCGMAYRKIKNYDAAIKCLHHALDLDNVSAKAFHVLGMIYADTEDYMRALECLENATGLAPKHSEYRVSFGLVLEKASLDLEAGIQYHKACEIDPNYCDGFTFYGAYLLKNHRHDEALECFNRAEVLAPNNLSIWDSLGQTYLGMGDTDAALAKFNEALKLEPRRLSALIGIENVYQETGKLDDALKLCDDIIALDPSLPRGYILKSRITKSKPGDGLLPHLLRFTERDDIDTFSKVNLNFSLGKAFDDLNNYAEAFKYYAAGNAIRNETQHYDAESDKARVTKLIEIFSADFFQKHQNFGSESNLPVIIVGMPRSATTLTEQIISSHQDVIGAGEVSFWGRSHTAMPLRLNTVTPYPECVLELQNDQAKDIAGIYESTLRKIVGATNNPKHITDKMPHNFFSVGLIALLFPNVKIIHTKRNPIDTCLSIFFQNFNDGHPYSFDLENLGLHYKQYERIMQHWHSILPGRIMDINYADTIADPEFWSRKLIAHIGLEWDDACLTPHKLERSVKTASHWQVRQPIYKTSVARWKNYEEFLAPLIHALKGD